MDRNEGRTRKDQIDPAIAAAGWDLSDPRQVGFEVPVDGYDKEPWNGITDYVLHQPNGEIIAAVEAKRNSRTPQVAREQARHYVTEIGKKQSFAPFAFLANGVDTYFWDVDRSNPRLVSGFLSLTDLESRLYFRTNGTAFSSVPINPKIAGRAYQQEAIRRVCEAFDAGKRRALLVMATGTGKTRTAMALIDIAMRANRVRNVLFLADRDALVEQALSEGFKAHLPQEPRERILSGKVDLNKRLYVSTLQTMARCLDKFRPGFFDLIFFDEAHRSIFNKYSETFDFFDALMVGLTATPAKFIDRDTFRTFDCVDGIPTFLYTYEQAIEGRVLVDFSLYSAKTKFQRKGIRGVDLSEEERNALIEQGIDPDGIDFSGTDLEKTVSNKDTMRKQWEEIIEVCHKDESGQLPGKTIVFAMTQDHAKRLLETFEEMYPQYVDVAAMVHHDVERVHDGSYGDGLISKFKKRDLPRIAISVDMLDTGIDLPEITNLVFMKPVQSYIRLWQMIGRGTRSDEICKHREWLPNGTKTEFKIIDFWENDFEKEAEEDQVVTVPVLVTLFNTRLKILNEFIRSGDNAGRDATIADLRQLIAKIPQGSFTVRRSILDLEEVLRDEFWTFIGSRQANFLTFKIGPLLRFAPSPDVAEATFTSKVERLRHQIITKAIQPALLADIAEDVSRLPQFVLEKPENLAAAKVLTSKEIENEGPAALRDALELLAPAMRYRRERPNSFLTLDLPDYIESRGYITLVGSGERVFVQDYRKRVEDAILAVVDEHPVIEAIQAGRDVPDDDLLDLERKLRQRLGGNSYQLTEENVRRAYGLRVTSLTAFVRELLDLPLPSYEVAVVHKFDEFISNHTYSADQIRFLRAMQSVFLHRKRQLAMADLYEGVFASFGKNAAERFFTKEQLKEALAFANDLAA